MIAKHSKGLIGAAVNWLNTAAILGKVTPENVDKVLDNPLEGICLMVLWPSIPATGWRRQRRLRKRDAPPNLPRSSRRSFPSMPAPRRLTLTPSMPASPRLFPAFATPPTCSCGGWAHRAFLRTPSRSFSMSLWRRPSFLSNRLRTRNAVGGFSARAAPEHFYKERSSNGIRIREVILRSQPRAGDAGRNEGQIGRQGASGNCRQEAQLRPLCPRQVRRHQIQCSSPIPWT